LYLKISFGIIAADIPAASSNFQQAHSKAQAINPHDDYSKCPSENI